MAFPLLDWTNQPLPPFSGRTPRSRHASWKAAVAVAPRQATKSARYLAWLAQVEMATDQGAEDALNLPFQSICSIRGGLMHRGFVEPVGETKGKYGLSITIWRVTKAGQEAVGLVRATR